MIARILLVIALVVTSAPASSAAELSDGSVSLKFSSTSIARAVTEGGNRRGPALAVMKDDTILLGGGRSGGEILTCG